MFMKFMPWKSEGPTCSNSPQSSGNELIWSLATQWRCLGRPPRRKVQWFQATETTPDSSSLLGPKDLSARHLVRDEIRIGYDSYDDMKGTRIYQAILIMMATRLTLFCKTQFGHCCIQRLRIPSCLVLSKISKTKEEKRHYKPFASQRLIHLHLTPSNAKSTATFSSSPPFHRVKRSVVMIQYAMLQC